MELPTILSTDLEDIPAVAKRHVSTANSYEAMIRKHGALRSATRGYLASVTFADAMVGRVLDALESSQYASNTIVVLFSDHGYHIGEKQKYHKSTLWEESTRVPLIIAASRSDEPRRSLAPRRQPDRHLPNALPHSQTSNRRPISTEKAWFRYSLILPRHGSLRR